MRPRRQPCSSAIGRTWRAPRETARSATAVVVVPAPAERLTPHVEAFQAVVWHLLVSHPRLKAAATKWESTR